MAQIKFTNFGDSTLASGIAPGDTTITLATGTGALFPTLTGGDWFRAVIEDVTANKECIKVTARTGDILTVERAQEGTTARTFSVGSVVSLRLTVSSFDEYVAAVQSGDNTWTGAQTFRDNKFEITDDSDTSKKVVLQVSGVATATTRTLTVPDANITLAGTNATQTFSTPQRGTMTTDNDLSFDLSVTNYFVCTPTAGGTLTFTNIPSGQSGHVLFTNNGNYAISAAASTLITATDLTRISASGAYLLSYFTYAGNVYVQASGKLA